MKEISIEVGHLTLNEIYALPLPCAGLASKGDGVQAIVGYDINDEVTP